MKDLNQLIVILKKGIEKNSPYIKTINDPQLLIKYLQELNDVIGNHKIKTSVAMQISHLIMNKIRSIKHKDENVMLNLVLVGNPGCGKTVLGTCIAKIWYALGYLKGPQKQNYFNFENIQNNEENSNVFYIFLFIITIWLLVLMWNFYSNYGGLFTFLLLFILLIVIAAIFFNQHQNKPCNKKQEQNDGVMHDDEIIKIVSRVDFVGAYVGSTALKTKKLLEDNIGKVLFVDESYSLMQSPEDSFGMEALTAINLFMSQRPNEIIIIFAGYKDLLEKTVFAAQPGLKRRFMWQFDCEGYSGTELYDIFKFKLDKQHYQLDNEEEAKKLFIVNAESFPNYGGDVEKLIFYTKLEHSNDFMDNPEKYDINTLYMPQLQRGLNTLVENTVFSTEPEETDMSRFMSMFKSHQPAKPKPKKSHYNENLSKEECDVIKQALKGY